MAKTACHEGMARDMSRQAVGGMGWLDPCCRRICRTIPCLPIGARLRLWGTGEGLLDGSLGCDCPMLAHTRGCIAARAISA